MNDYERNEHIKNFDYAIDRFETLLNGTPMSGGDTLDNIKFKCAKWHQRLPFILRTLPADKISDAMLGEINAYQDFFQAIMKVYGDDQQTFINKLNASDKEDSVGSAEDIWAITDNMQLYFGFDL